MSVITGEGTFPQTYVNKSETHFRLLNWWMTMSLTSVYLLTEDMGFKAEAQQLQIKNTVPKLMASLLQSRGEENICLALISFSVLI